MPRTKRAVPSTHTARDLSSRRLRRGAFVVYAWTRCSSALVAPCARLPRDAHALDVKPLTGFWQDQWECLFGQLRAFIDCGNLTMAAFLDALYAKNVRRPGHAGYRHQSRARAKRTNVGRNDMNTVARESDKELNEAAIAALVAELEPAAKPVEASEADTPRGVGSGQQSVLSEADSADDSDTDDNDESLDVPDG
mmetsp:Transcript_22664/g.61365  ORF Transcript_22664/g.61365 Transcript_22664/m.61365 type:complete len:195 (-) Transcript_22664:572-1156(-)